MFARQFPARILLSAILSAAILTSPAVRSLVASGQDVPPTAQIEVAPCDVPVVAIFQADAERSAVSPTWLKWLPGIPPAIVVESTAGLSVRNGLFFGPRDIIAVDRDSLVARSIRLQV